MAKSSGSEGGEKGWGYLVVMICIAGQKIVKALAVR
jgi:hypothetical protein